MSPERFPVSVEFFPPKSPEGVEKLRTVRQALYARKPEFCSVTFGAGGSTQEGTFSTVRDILADVLRPLAKGEPTAPAHTADTKSK